MSHGQMPAEWVKYVMRAIGLAPKAHWSHWYQLHWFSACFHGAWLAQVSQRQEELYFSLKEGEWKLESLWIIQWRRKNLNNWFYKVLHKEPNIVQAAKQNWEFWISWPLWVWLLILKSLWLAVLMRLCLCSSNLILLCWGDRWAMLSTTSALTMMFS